MTQYQRGRALEYRVRDYFLDLGFCVVRAAGSKGKIDLVCMKGGVTWLVQCKLRTWPGPAERLELGKAASVAGFPAVAARVRGGKLEFRGITWLGKFAPVEPF